MEIRFRHILLIALWLSIFIPFSSGRAGDKLERQFEDPITALSIENLDGITEVEASPDSSVRVMAWRLENSEATLDSEVIFEWSDKSLRIEVNRLARTGPVNLRVHVPAGIRLSVKSGQGKVVIRGRTNALFAETESGDVTLFLPASTNAELSLRAIEGTIVFQLPITVFGTANPQLLDGRLGSGGYPVIVRSIRGRIRLLEDDSAGQFAANGKKTETVTASTTDTRDREHSSQPSLAAKLRQIYSSADSAGEHLASTIAAYPTRKSDVLRLEARLVNLNVKVTDKAGKAVPNLTKEEFQIFENDVPQDVSHFEPVTSPVSLVLLLDFSGSTRDKTKVMKRAAKKFVESLRKEDRVAIALFTTRFYIVSGFTSDQKLLKKRIDDIGNRGGDTALYDAAWASFDLFNDEKERRKALVVLTDGVDSSMESGERERGSKRSFDELLMRVIEEEATVYPIYLDTEYEIVVKGGTYTHEIFAAARRQLELLAEQTGGTWFKAARIEDLEGVYERVASELHTLYSLGYHSRDTRKDGRWRRINVKVSRSGSAVRSKRGYFAK